jgi:hypothetical protein
VLNGGRASTMQQTIARIAGASYEFFSGKPLPKPVKAKQLAKNARPRRR